MYDTIHVLTVTLVEDIGDERMSDIVKAISLLQGVTQVTVANAENAACDAEEERVSPAIVEKVAQVIKHGHGG